MGRSLKQIKKTTQSIKSTRKTTHTMQLISVSRLQKVLKLVKPLSAYTKDITTILNASAPKNTIWNKARPKAPNLIIAFAADRGLCGGFNTEIVKRSRAHMLEQGGTWKVIAIGKRASPLATLTKSDLVSVYPSLGKTISPVFLNPLVAELKNLIQFEQVGKISIAWTSYKSALAQEVLIEPLVEDYKENNAVSLEPNPESVHEAVVERAILYRLYRAAIESSTSEQNARMTAMKQATDSATDIIEQLTLEYNKGRQQAITQEIAQITSGAQFT